MQNVHNLFIDNYCLLWYTIAVNKRKGMNRKTIGCGDNNLTLWDKCTLFKSIHLDCTNQ